MNFQRFLELILVDEFFQSSSLSFWVMNLKNTNKELSEEHTCERGAPGDLKRGQAGRPRAMGPAGLGFSWPSSTSSFSGDFLAQFLASVQYIFYALHHPKPVHHSFLVLVVHLQHYFFTLCHSLCPIFHHSRAWLLPSLDHLHVVVGREHNSFP